MDNSILEFQNLCNKINDIAGSFVEKELIDHESAFEAYSYVKLMSLEERGDYLLFLAAVNLLNTYVKQSDSKITYHFKNELSYCIDRLLITKKDFLKYNNDNNLFIFEMDKLQFSFHFVKLNVISQIVYDANLKWDGIRKQPCALTIFNICKTNNILISDKTIRGKGLKKQVEKFLNNFRNSKMDFEDIFK